MAINWKLLNLMALCSLLAGCAAAVNCDVVAFHSLSSPQGEEIRVVHQDPDKTSSPEFAFYAAHVEKGLQGVGYNVSGTKAEDLIFAINYGVGPAADEVVNFPKCSMRYHFRNDGSDAPYSYGMHCLDAPTEIRTQYHHFLDVKVHSANTDGSNTDNLLYEGVVHSLSMDDNLSALMPYLVAAMFNDFPGESGQSRTVTIEHEEAAHE